MAGWIKEQLDKPRAAITDDSAPDPKAPQSLRYLGRALKEGAQNVAKAAMPTTAAAEKRYSRSR